MHLLKATKSQLKSYPSAKINPTKRECVCARGWTTDSFNKLILLKKQK